MKNDDPVCLCFHVTRRKVVNFIRIEKPRRPSQLSECFGAGTGCGWCRPYLERLLLEELAKTSSVQPASDTTHAGVVETTESNELTAAEYARERTKYVQAGKGTPPPGATPIDDDENDPNSDAQLK